MHQFRIEAQVTEYTDLRDRVAKHMGWDTEKADWWMRSENPLLGNQTPEHMIAIGRGHKVRRFIELAIEENGPAREGT